MAIPIPSKEQPDVVLIDEPWKRAYVIFTPGAETHFVPDRAEEAALT